MQSINYFEAWKIWFSGAKLDDFQMGFMSMLWWGRAGKIIQVVAGLVVLFDLLDKQWMKKLSRRFDSRCDREFNEISFRPLGMIVYVSIWILSSGLLGFLAIRFLLDVVGWWVMSTFILFCVALGRYVAGQVFIKVYALMRVAAKPLEGHHPVRWAAFVFALYGFHLDLLAS